MGGIKILRKNRQFRAPKFSVGEIVRVRAREEISQSLDTLGRLEGCLMMDQMWEYCGKSFKILKVIWFILFLSALAIPLISQVLVSHVSADEIAISLVCKI